MLRGLSKTQIIVATLSLQFGCAADRSPKTVAKQKASADAATSIPCDKTNKCPIVPMAINANPLQNGRLMGTVTAKEPWTFTGIAQGDKSRDYRMFAFNPPASGNFLGQGTLSIRVEYNAFEATEGQVPIDVIMRDVSRCKFNAVGRESLCEDLTQKGFEAFELKTSVPWSITDGEIITDPSFTSDQGPQLGAQGGMVGCTQGFLPGLLGGITSGSMIGGIFRGALGCISNATQNAGN